jgi:hypothetical protein
MFQACANSLGVYLCCGNIDFKLVSTDSVAESSNSNCWAVSGASRMAIICLFVVDIDSRIGVMMEPVPSISDTMGMRIVDKEENKEKGRMKGY